MSNATGAHDPSVADYRATALRAGRNSWGMARHSAAALLAVGSGRAVRMVTNSSPAVG